MSLYKRYEGEFLSRKGVIWRAEIWQEAEVQFPIVGELQFPAESPLTIEWAHTDKEEVICGSTASLTIVSPGDRTYEDLYSVQPGRVRMDVYRNGNLYWSGTLDPEFYEEPYSSYKEYDVQLTFSDFGILDRYKYSMTGVKTLYDIIKNCIDISGINYVNIRQDYISTSLNGTTPMQLSELSIRSENFYDEDGEALSLYEVLEGILQPLGIRIVQRNAQVWMYDLNGLYTKADSKEVEWTDSDQALGTDKVVNDVCITFSPYANSELPTGEIKYEGEYSEEYTNLKNTAPYSGPECYTYFPDYEKTWDNENLSFTIFLSDKGSGLESINSECRYFHIQPLLGGTESEGIAHGFYTGGHDDLKSGGPVLKLKLPSAPDGTVLMRCKRVPIHHLGAITRTKYTLRLSMEILLDPRYNPFEDKSKYNESGNYDRFNSWINFAMVPANIILTDQEGNALYHYTNTDIAMKKGINGSINYTTKGRWISGEPSGASCWLSWYDLDDRERKSGILGWKMNRHTIGITKETPKESFKQTDAGQYIPYPPAEGYINIIIYSGIKLYDENDNLPEMSKAIKEKLWNKIRWMLYKTPKLEVVNSNIVHSPLKNEDVEYKGILNKGAKENLELETICGSMKNPQPTAMGVYLYSLSKEQILAMSRGGRTAQVEQLLIGTLYSQYAKRKTKLTGTVRILKDMPMCYTEACQHEKRFICLEDIQNVIADESCMELVELRPDEYEEEN